MSAHADDVHSRSIVAKALGKAADVATLPEVMARILEITDDPERGANELFDIIRRDPVLSARLLQVVNSAFYGLPGQVADLDRAIVLLGMKQVRNLAIATSAGEWFRASPDRRLFDARELWRHSVAVSVAARELALLAGDRNGAPELFLAGLIHDIGLLFERQALPDPLAGVVRFCNTSHSDGLLAAERRVIGATHEEFGEALAAKWRFPRRLRQAVGNHHRPWDLPEEQRRSGYILHCADVLCCNEGLGLDLSARDQELDAATVASAGISFEQLPLLRETLYREVDAMEVLLDLAA